MLIFVLLVFLSSFRHLVLCCFLLFPVVDYSCSTLLRKSLFHRCRFYYYPAFFLFPFFSLCIKEKNTGGLLRIPPPTLHFVQQNKSTFLKRRANETNERTTTKHRTTRFFEGKGAWIGRLKGRWKQTRRHLCDSRAGLERRDMFTWYFFDLCLSFSIFHPGYTHGGLFLLVFGFPRQRRLADS